MSVVLTQAIDECLHHKKHKKLRSLLAHEDLGEIGEALTALRRGKKKTFGLLSPERQADVIFYVNEDTRDQLLDFLSSHDFALMLHFMDDDDAVDLLQSVSEEKRNSILGYLRTEKKRRMDALLKFHPETAGGLMDFNFLVVEEELNLKTVFDKVHTYIEKQRQTPLVIVAAKDGQLKGYVPYQDLMMGTTKVPLPALIKPMPAILPAVDQEEVVVVARKQRSEVVAVVDEFGKVLGVIHLKDLMRVAEFEATEDIYRLAGLSKEEQVSDSIFTKVNRRYKWLVVNLATAFFAAFVVSRFQETISQVSILAVYMPIVAGQGGNAGTQALAVVIRGLALGEIPWGKARGIIIKEAVAGLLNGVLVGFIASGVALLFGAPVMLGLVLGVSIILNLFIAGFFGTLVPFTLKALKIDPAVASAVFVTTATDVFGFLCFLGLGTLFLIQA
jgi:magnesium transporter